MNNENTPTISRKELLSQCLKLCIEACKITSQCYQNSNVQKFDKGGGNDPVTEADFKIQTMIVRGLKKIWPTLRIIGEEETEFVGDIDVDYDKLENVNLPEGVNFNGEYNIEDICVWIDPIDNTRGFIEGEAEAVTNLIGVSYKKKAELGIIGVPFKKNEGQTAVYNPSVCMGGVESKFSFEYEIMRKEWKQLKVIVRNENHIPKITVSPTRKNIIEGVIQSKLKAHRIYAGGAGYKVVLVVNGVADLLAYCESFTKKWDSCAGHALMESMGGFLTDQKGDEIEYDPNKKSYVNSDGILCGFNEEYKKVAIETFLKERSIPI